MQKFSSTMRASSRRTSRKRKLGLIAAGTLVLVAIISLLPRAASWTAAVVMVPVLSTQHWLAESTAALPSYLRDRNDLIGKKHELEERLAALSGADLTIERLQAENESLRGLLSASSSPRVAASVLAQPTALPYDVLLIDRGSRDGIVRHAPVYVSGDRVIGLVSEVYPSTSLVTLVTAPGLESTVYILGPDIYTTAVGQGGGTLRVEVPQGIPLSVGNLVLLPAFSGGVFGEIVIVDAHETRPAQYGYVSLSQALHEIRSVSIGTSPLRPLSFEDAKSAVDTVKRELTTVPVPEGVLVELPNEASSTATSTASGTASTSASTTRQTQL